MPIEDALTEDEKALLRLVERYRWAERSGRKALRDAAIAHYRKAKEEATHGEQARIEAEIRALAPRGLYRNVLDLAKQIGRRMSGCKVRAASEFMGGSGLHGDRGWPRLRVEGDRVQAPVACRCVLRVRP